MTRDTLSYVFTHVADEIAELLEPELGVFPPEALDRVDALQFVWVSRHERLDESLAQVGNVRVVVREGLEEEGPVDSVEYLGTLEDIEQFVELLDGVERTTEQKEGLWPESWRH